MPVIEVPEKIKLDNVDVERIMRKLRERNYKCIDIRPIGEVGESRWYIVAALRRIDPAGTIIPCICFATVIYGEAHIYAFDANIIIGALEAGIGEMIKKVYEEYDKLMREREMMVKQGEEMSGMSSEGGDEDVGEE